MVMPCGARQVGGGGDAVGPLVARSGARRPCRPARQTPCIAEPGPRTRSTGASMTSAHATRAGATWASPSIAWLPVPGWLARLMIGRSPWSWSRARSTSAPESSASRGLAAAAACSRGRHRPWSCWPRVTASRSPRRPRPRSWWRMPPGERKAGRALIDPGSIHVETRGHGVTERRIHHLLPPAAPAAPAHPLRGLHARRELVELSAPQARHGRPAAGGLSRGALLLPLRPPGRLGLRPGLHGRPLARRVVRPR